MQSHATHPFALHLKGDVYRIYFSCRDGYNRSHVGYVELDLTEPRKILQISETPALAPGPLGHFDDHGVYGGCLVRRAQQLWMFYVGWIPGVTPPLFYSSIGAAISDEHGKVFRRVPPAPIMDRSRFDPCSVLMPHVIAEAQTWKMWYGSGIKWKDNRGQLQSYYDIKYAESDNGIRWQRNGTVCIPLVGPERNIGHPFVLKEEIYRMWYSYNAGEGYRIGYAESPDGCAWVRKDAEVGISVSDSGWDAQTISHPHVFIHRDKRYMLYNGNNFGKDGFGLAKED